MKLRRIVQRDAVHPVLGGATPDVDERWTAVLNGILTSRKPLRVVTNVNLNGMQFLEAEILLAPLRDDQGDETMVLTVVVFRSGVAKSTAVNDLVHSC